MRQAELPLMTSNSVDNFVSSSERAKSKAKFLDQFFTKKDVSKRFVAETIKTLKKTDFNFDKSLFIEPSAGLGCFLYNIREEGFEIKAYDIDPQIKEVEKTDFLNDLIATKKKSENVAIIGNPPFGKSGRLALEFVVKGFEYGDFVCFILPNNFQKYSMQRLLPKDVKIISQYKLPKNSFYTMNNGMVNSIDIGCVFQILTTQNTKMKDLRIREKPPITHKDFILYQYNNTQEALKYFKEDFETRKKL